MGISPEDIEYWRLSPADRLVLAQDIIDSVLAESSAPPLSLAEIAELRSRVDDIDTGRVRCEPWPNVRGRLCSQV